MKKIITAVTMEMSPQVVYSRPGSHRVLRDRSPLTSTKNERRGSAKVDIKNRGRGLDNG